MKLSTRIKSLSQKQKIVMGLLSFVVVVIVSGFYLVGFNYQGIVSQADETSITNQSLPSVDFSENQNPVNVPTPESSVSESNLESTTNNQLTQLPANIQPVFSDSKSSIVISLNDTMDNWTLWLIYIVIPLVVTGLIIYFYFRKKSLKREEIL